MADNLTVEQRKYCMSRVRTKDTDIERLVRTLLRRNGVRFQNNAKDLPGKPDIVFRREKVVVFIDGDFWHGYRFPAWRHRVSEFWVAKIEGNRRRDQRTFRRLRKSGWRVIRLWQHDVKGDGGRCVNRILAAVAAVMPRAEPAKGVGFVTSR